MAPGILIATMVGLLAGDDTSESAKVSVDALRDIAGAFKFDVRAPSGDCSC